MKLIMMQNIGPVHNSICTVVSLKPGDLVLFKYLARLVLGSHLRASGLKVSRIVVDYYEICFDGMASSSLSVEYPYQEYDVGQTGAYDVLRGSTS